MLVRHEVANLEWTDAPEDMTLGLDVRERELNLTVDTSGSQESRVEDV